MGSLIKISRSAIVTEERTQARRFSPSRRAFGRFGSLFQRYLFEELKSMKRRDFVSLFGWAAVAWPLFAHAQERQGAVIGFLNSGSRNSFETLVAEFNRGLREQGYDEQRNLSLEYRWAEGHNERLGALASDLVA